jgi:hypothetical protein
MAADPSAGLDPHHDDLKHAPRDPLRGHADAAEPVDLPAAAEVDPFHGRSTTAAEAWPKPMHLVATP